MVIYWPSFLCSFIFLWILSFYMVFWTTFQFFIWKKKLNFASSLWALMLLVDDIWTEHFNIITQLVYLPCFKIGFLFMFFSPFLHNLYQFLQSNNPFWQFFSIHGKSFFSSSLKSLGVNSWFTSGNCLHFFTCCCLDNSLCLL